MVSSVFSPSLRAIVVGGLLFGMTGCGGGGGDLQVTDIEPRAGATEGEQPIRVLGNNFRRDIGYTVYFGTKRAERSTLLDDHTLLVATPPQDEASTVDVIVVADNGPAYRIRQGFIYNAIARPGQAPGGGPAERF
jgi:hypothetical protein